MHAGKQALFERLDRGPCFLLLGQRYLSIETGSDPLTGPLARALGVGELQQSVYQTVLGIDPARRQAVANALTEAGRALVLPPPARTTLHFPWNGVLSSAVDPAWRAGLRREWRTIQQSVPQRDRTRVSRNVYDVQALMLFGGVDQPAEDQPPSTRPDLTRRRAIAAEALGRVVSDALTPRGLLVIEGWGLDDWLTPEMLYAQICDSVRGQVHLFSATDEILADDHIREAIDLQVLVPHRESFASVVVEARSTGRLSEERPSTAPTRALRVGDRLLPIDRSRWQRILPHARPVDIDVLDDPPAESADRRYQKFREFLGTSDGSPAWWAHARGLSFQRSFEQTLWDLVEQTVGSRNQRAPLLVAGQSGTGKSVALARLAFRTAHTGRRVVLHIPRRSTRPEYEALDDFCLWAEEQTGDSTLIVWDGMLEPQEYQRLFDYLRSRGRKVVVVGSCYWDEELFGVTVDRRNGQSGRSAPPVPRYVPGRDFIEATATLAGKELQRFINYLGHFGIRLKPGDEQAVSRDKSFLSALYRLLPEVHGPLSSGLALELRRSEQRLSHAARTRMDFQANTLMAHALVKAGLLNGLAVLLDRPNDAPSMTADDPFERLLSLVLLIHSHGLRMPLELALRTVGRDGVRNLPDLLSGIDIIRWDEDEQGNYTLGGRNQLEARLLTQARGSGKEREAAQIAEVLELVRPDARARNGGPEIEFAIELLTRIGPQVAYEQRLYGEHYLAFADSIAELRSRVSDPVVHARLTHKEVNLRREWAVRDQRRQGTDPSTRQAALEAAQEAVDEALRTAEDLGLRPQIKLNLFVEQASVRGSRLYELLHSAPNGRLPNPPPSEEYITDELRALQRSVQSALSCDGTNYYPVDVLCWASRDTLKAGVLSDEAAATLLGDCLSTLTAIDPDTLDPRQAALYHSKFQDIAAWADDRVLAEQQLKKLEEYDEPLAAFFYALKVSGFLQNDPQPEGVRRALEHLRAQPSRLQDERCIRIAVDLLWFARTGERFMSGERQTLPLDGTAWQECLDLTDLATTYDVASSRVLFMRALALFHLGRVTHALDAFRELDRLSFEQRDRRRVINVYLASSEDGMPKVFRARVLRVDSGFRGGRCWVEDYQREFPFDPSQFGADQAVVGRTLDAYAVFNMRGPWLEPPREPGERRGPQLLGPAGERQRETKGAR
ncbi:P-loop NTPase [Streptomyces bobili]|uniref:P-loop NTPase n=1 Tax=Streptomyces bobili TaxID=67280 RepID=UPI003721774B